MTRTTTVSMEDRVEEIREQEIAPRQEQIDEIRGKAKEYDNPWEIPDELESRYEKLKKAVRRLEGEADTLEHYASEWGGDLFEIRELSVGGVSQIQDDVAEASGMNFKGDGTPKSGYARTRTLEVAVKDSPPGAPVPADLPDAVGDWLYDCVDEFNTTGKVQMGNTSLRAEMINSEN